MKLLLAVLLILSCRAADRVETKDGDRFTGVVQSRDGGVVVIKTKYSDAPLQIALDQVASVSSDSEEEEQQSAGWLRRAWNRSSVTVDFDQSYSGLAKYNQLSSNSEYDYKGDRWDGNLITHLDYYGGSESESSTYQLYGRLVGQRYFRGDKFFLFPYLFLGRQTTATSRGQIRQAGGGAGYTFQRHAPNQVSLFAGVIFSSGNGFASQNEEDRVDTRFSEPFFISAATWDRTDKHKIETTVRIFYYKPMLLAGRHGIATDASAKIPLFGPAYFTVSAYDTPELNQRQVFSTKNLKLSSGIGIRF